MLFCRQRFVRCLYRNRRELPAETVPDALAERLSQTAHKYTEEELKEILEKIADEEVKLGTVLRAKGIVAPAEGEWFHFDLVPGEYEIRRGSADYTGRICVIGAKLDEDGLKELFAVKK